MKKIGFTVKEFVKGLLGTAKMGYIMDDFIEHEKLSQKIGRMFDNAKEEYERSQIETDFFKERFYKRK